MDPLNCTLAFKERERERDRFHSMVFTHSNLRTNNNNKRSKVSNESYQRYNGNILLLWLCLVLFLCVTHTLVFSLHWSHFDSIWCHFMLNIHYGNFRLSVLVTETHTIHNYLIRILSFGYTVFTIYVQRTYLTVDSKSYTKCIFRQPHIWFYYTLNLLLLFFPHNSASPSWVW